MVLEIKDKKVVMDICKRYMVMKLSDLFVRQLMQYYRQDMVLILYKKLIEKRNRLTQFIFFLHLSSLLGLYNIMFG